MKKIIFGLLITLSSFSIAKASEITSAFDIAQIYVSNADNMYFRVYDGDATALCTGGEHWAYINESDSGAKMKMAALMTASATSKQVVLVTEPIDFYTNGHIYCHITEVVVKN